MNHRQVAVAKETWARLKAAEKEIEALTGQRDALAVSCDTVIAEWHKVEAELAGLAQEAERLRSVYTALREQHEINLTREAALQARVGILQKALRTWLEECAGPGCGDPRHDAARQALLDAEMKP